MKKFGKLLLLLSLVMSICATMCIGIFAGTAGEEKDTPYVDDGLVLWLDGFDKDSVTFNADGSAVWKDKISGTEYTLEGKKDGTANTGWQLMANGGVGYEMTADAMSGSAVNRLNLGTLPAGDYTVEIIMTVGDPAAGGSVKSALYRPAFSFGGFNARLDYTKQNDIYVTNGGSFYMTGAGNMVNPLGAFVGLSDESVNRIALVCDATSGVQFNGTTTTDGTPLLNKTGAAGEVTTATYTLYQNEKPGFSFSTDSVYVAGGQYNNTIAMPTGDLVIAENAPATIYSVRIYNRVLSEEEMTENHIADLSLYYDIDLASFYAQAGAFTSEELASFYNKISARGFDMTKNEAEGYFDGFAISYAVEFLGMSVEYSGYNGIRAIFGVNDAIIKKYEQQGYKVTYGALVGYASDYPDTSALTIDATTKKAMITAYANGEKNFSYVLAEELGNTSFAITTFLGPDATIDEMQTGFVYNAFLIMEKDGKTDVYYLNAADDEIGKLSVYNTLKYYSENGYSSVDNIKVLLETYKLYGHIYVDPSVKESGAGTTASTALKTVPEAYALAVEMINGGEFSDILIHLSAGNHSLAQQLVVKGEDFHVPNYSVTFTGEGENNSSVLTSVVDIPGKEFTRVSGTKTYVYQLPETAKNEKGEWPAFRDLFIDGKPATMARTDGLYYMRVDSCKKASDNGLEQDDRLLYVQPSALGNPNINENGDVIGDLEFWVIEEWRIHSVHIEHIDWNKDTGFVQNGEPLVAVRVREDDWGYLSKAYNTTLAGRIYWFSNNEEYLDEKGEYYYDALNGKIYVVPNGATMNNVDSVSYPRTERLFYFQDAENVTFENLSIFGTTNNYVTKYGYLSGQGGHIKRPLQDENGVEYGKNVGFLPLGALYGESVKNIVIDNCSFYAHGGDAINFRGAVDNVKIINSSFVNIGATAIRFGKNNADYNATSHNKDILIQNNYIENTGTNFNSNTGILISSAMDVDILNNTILDSAYSAISVGWRWGSVGSTSIVNLTNVNIAYNYIERFMTKMRDGGAIYTLGGNAPEGTPGYYSTMHDNYVVMSSDIGNNTNHWTIFYHDQGSSHWHDYNNVLVIHPEAHVASHAYYSYQTINGNVHSIKTENLYVIGYHPDVLLGWGEYNRETGEYGIAAKAEKYTQEQWEEYMPDWVDELYPNWYEEWIVKGNIPTEEFFGFGIAGTVAGANEWKDKFTYVREEDGAYAPYLDYFAVHNDSMHFYLYSDFDQAEKEGKSDTISAIAAAAGCEGHAPKYGKYTAR